jgi:hypothetical protein
MSNLMTWQDLKCKTRVMDDLFVQSSEVEVGK